MSRKGPQAQAESQMALCWEQSALYRVQKPLFHTITVFNGHIKQHLGFKCTQLCLLGTVDCDDVLYNITMANY